jgi:hypothetical protein
MDRLRPVLSCGDDGEQPAVNGFRRSAIADPYRSNPRASASRELRSGRLYLLAALVFST